MSFDVTDGPVELKGGTDGTKIGNVSDALKTTATLVFNPDDAIAPFDLAVAKGGIAKHSLVNKFGSNPSIKSTAFETIWTYGDLYPWPTSAQQVNVSSTSTNDTNTAGTGARTVTIQGLNGSYVETEETINMNGTTNVLSTNSYLRIHRAFTVTAGSLGYNDGDITCTQSASPTDVICQIEAEKNQTLQCFYTVPAANTLYLTSYYFTSANSLPAVVELYAREFGGVFRIKHRLDIGASLPIGDIKIFTYPAKTDIDFRALAQTGSHRVSAGFSGYLVED
jgi:hypothetical protein